MSDQKPFVEIIGFRLGYEHEEKIDTILGKLKENFSLNNMTWTIRRNEKIFESFFLGEYKGNPIGFYQRSASVMPLIKSSYGKAKKEVRKKSFSVMKKDLSLAC